jgi:hypothetical protein
VALAINAFNRGLLSPLALARTDFDRTRLSAEVMTNWMPRALGSMMLRPGMKYTGGTKNNLPSVTIPFIFATDDTARLEITEGAMQVWVDDVLVTRESVSTSITNGTFLTDVTGWSDQDGGLSVSAWATGGFLSLIGTETAAAKRRQAVTVTDVNVRHALKIVIERGPVMIRVGTAAGLDDYIPETSLGTGQHSLAFTPTGNFSIDLFNYNKAASLVDSINVESAGAMEVAAPWLSADLENLRWDQSGDIVFVACEGKRQRKIERRATDSWSIVVYQSDNGPFQIQNIGPVTLTPGATSGDTTLTASAPLFKSTQIGTLFSLTQPGQTEDVSLTAQNQFSDPIRITGVDAARQFAVIITGTWTGTITLQYSLAAPGNWVDATAGSYTSNVSVAYDDTLDNQVIYYRIGIKTGDYGSGTATATLSATGGTQTGVCRVTSFTSSTVVNIGIIDEFGSMDATDDWSESYWSDRRGYPSSVALYEGRLWWAGKDRMWGSVSDGFYNFDDTTEGDSGPINRSIGSGPVDKIHWLLPLQRLLLGAGGSIFSARSNSLDEPLTPTNFNLKDVSTQGARNALAAKVDKGGIFVQRSGSRVMSTVYDPDSYDYGATDLTSHVPEVGEPEIIKIVAQRQPETRLHCIRSDGTVAILIFDPVEEIKCWVGFETTGIVEDAVVLPGEIEDQVYYTIQRTIDGSAAHYHEKWAMESECIGGTLNKQLDSFVEVSGSPLSGLIHLEGETVRVWGDGAYVGEFTVSGGTVVVDTAVTSAIAGLGYTAPWKSSKLAYGVPDGQTALCMPKRINQLGIIARNIHPQGLEFGPDFTTMDNLPLTEDGYRVGQSVVREVYDEATFSFPGEWSTDSRLCLRATAPLPVTLLAAVIDMETNVG